MNQTASQHSASPDPELATDALALLRSVTITVHKYALKNTVSRWPHVPNETVLDLFVYVRHGHFRVILGSEEYVVGPGTTFCCPARTYMRWEVPVGEPLLFDQLATTLTIADGQALLQYLELPRCLRGNSTAAVAAVMEELAATKMARPSGTYITWVAGALQLVHLFAWAPPSDHEPPAATAPPPGFQRSRYTAQRRRQVATWVAEMAAACRQEDIPSVNELAKQADMSRKSFTRLFVEVTGKAPTAILRELRIAQACTLLRETDETVGQIGVRTGYTDPYHFSRAFSKTVGESPSAYRERHAAKA